MTCKECRACKKFLTNDCPGSEVFDKGACQEVLKKKGQEIDVSGCC